MDYQYLYGFNPENEYTFEAAADAPKAVITWDGDVYDLDCNAYDTYLYRLRAGHISTRGAVEGSPYCDPGEVFVESQSEHTLINEGEYYTKLHRVVLRGQPDQDQIDYYVKTEFPGTYCQHDYDCCGNFYASSGTLEAQGYDSYDDETILYITQSWSLNI